MTSSRDSSSFPTIFVLVILVCVSRLQLVAVCQDVDDSNDARNLRVSVWDPAELKHDDGGNTVDPSRGRGPHRRLGGGLKKTPKTSFSAYQAGKDYSFGYAVTLSTDDVKAGKVAGSNSLIDSDGNLHVTEYADNGDGYWANVYTIGDFQQRARRQDGDYSASGSLEQHLPILPEEDLGEDMDNHGSMPLLLPPPQDTSQGLSSSEVPLEDYPQQPLFPIEQEGQLQDIQRAPGVSNSNEQAPPADSGPDGNSQAQKNDGPSSNAQEPSSKEGGTSSETQTATPVKAQHPKNSAWHWRQMAHGQSSARPRGEYRGGRPYWHATPPNPSSSSERSSRITNSHGPDAERLHLRKRTQTDQIYLTNSPSNMQKPTIFHTEQPPPLLTRPQQHPPVPTALDALDIGGGSAISRETVAQSTQQQESQPVEASTRAQGMRQSHPAHQMALELLSTRFPLRSHSNGAEQVMAQVRRITERKGRVLSPPGPGSSVSINGDQVPLGARSLGGANDIMPPVQQVTISTPALMELTTVTVLAAGQSIGGHSGKSQAEHSFTAFVQTSVNPSGGLAPPQFTMNTGSLPTTFRIEPHMMRTQTGTEMRAPKINSGDELASRRPVDQLSDSDFNQGDVAQAWGSAIKQNPNIKEASKSPRPSVKPMTNETPTAPQLANIKLGSSSPSEKSQTQSNVPASETPTINAAEVAKGLGFDSETKDLLETFLDQKPSDAQGKAQKTTREPPTTKQVVTAPQVLIEKGVAKSLGFDKETEQLLNAFGNQADVDEVPKQRSPELRTLTKVAETSPRSEMNSSETAVMDVLRTFSALHASGKTEEPEVTTEDKGVNSIVSQQAFESMKKFREEVTESDSTTTTTTAPSTTREPKKLFTKDTDIKQSEVDRLLTGSPKLPKPVSKKSGELAPAPLRKGDPESIDPIQSSSTIARSLPINLMEATRSRVGEQGRTAVETQPPPEEEAKTPSITVQEDSTPKTPESSTAAAAGLPAATEKKNTRKRKGKKVRMQLMPGLEGSTEGPHSLGLELMKSSTKSESSTSTATKSLESQQPSTTSQGESSTKKKEEEPAQQAIVASADNVALSVDLLAPAAFLPPGLQVPNGPSEVLLPMKDTPLANGPEQGFLMDPRGTMFNVPGNSPPQQKRRRRKKKAQTVADETKVI